MEQSISVVIPAFSHGESGMNSGIPLPLHKVGGRSMLLHAIHTARKIVDAPPLILTNKDMEQFQKQIQSLARIVEVPPLNEAKETPNTNGTPNTIETPELLENTTVQTINWEQLLSLVHMSDAADLLVLLPVNMPLVTEASIQNMILYTQNNELDIVVMPSESFSDDYFQQNWISDASGLCQNDSSLLQQVCCVSVDWLKSLSAEYRAPRAGVFHPADESELLAVNDRVKLAAAETNLRLRINEYHMRNGVTFIDPNQTYIGPEVQIGRDTLLYPGNVLEGRTIIGEGCTLYPNNRLDNAIIANRVTLQSSVILDSSVGEETTVGPYAYIRPESKIGSHVRIGDFVEVKKSVIGNGTKVSHLTYIGDAHFGDDVNVGCGVVCVNYDGKRKQKVTVGDHAFIGCNVNLIAPVEVEDHAYVAAGSTITDKVPAKALAIARARQVNKEGWVDRREQRLKKEK